MNFPISDIGYVIGYERPHSFTMTFNNRTATNTLLTNCTT